MNYTRQTSFADMFEYYCARNVTNEREYNEREMLRWLKQQLAEAHRAAEESAKDAHKRGWEQAKREAFEVARTAQIGQIQTTIASMEYKKEVEDD